MDTLALIVENIGKKNKIHANNLRAFLDNASDEFKVVAEDYLSHYCKFLQDKFDIDMEFIVDSYLMMVQDIVVEQVRFMRKGVYRYSTIEDADLNVYSNKEYMFQYMIGVALSQFLWKNHKEMFEFFQENIRKYSSNNYLEIGCGHGLFFAESIKNNFFKNYQAIDISQTSIEITSSFIHNFFGNIPANVNFSNQDVTKASVEKFGKFDFITMGEVLEHVENPKELLLSIYKLLSDNGYAYISTCANCPVRDHIYLYNTIDEIREELAECGLSIQEEIIISNDKIKEEDWIQKKSNLSYAAIVSKTKK